MNRPVGRALSGTEFTIMFTVLPKLRVVGLRKRQG